MTTLTHDEVQAILNRSVDDVLLNGGAKPPITFRMPTERHAIAEYFTGSARSMPGGLAYQAIRDFAQLMFDRDDGPTKTLGPLRLRNAVIPTGWPCPVGLAGTAFFSPLGRMLYSDREDNISRAFWVSRYYQQDDWTAAITFLSDLAIRAVVAGSPLASRLVRDLDKITNQPGRLTGSNYIWSDIKIAENAVLCLAAGSHRYWVDPSPEETARMVVGWGGDDYPEGYPGALPLGRGQIALRQGVSAAAADFHERWMRGEWFDPASTTRTTKALNIVLGV